MSGEYTYYSDGFFGFGPPGTFHPYGWMHFAPLLVCVGLLFLVWLKRDRLRNWTGEIHLRYVLSFLMFLFLLGYYMRLLYVGDSSGRYVMMAKLPLHVCDLGLIANMYMVTSKNRSLFGINFFVTLFGATLACIIPQTVLVEAGPTYFRYYQYFGIHLIPLFCTVYMIVIHRMRPRYCDIWIAVAALAAMLIPSIWMNEKYPASDYMFLRLDIPLFPENQYLRAGIYTVLIIIVFHLMWLIWGRFLRSLEGEQK
ncbi:MAG: YwaF family protein [Parasporobacterium sp.]|nr:YwaF family protein [Parasporobacterium sp.]